MKISSLNIVQGTDATAALQYALDEAAGGILEFDEPVEYIVGRLYVRSGTTITMVPGVSFRKRVNAAGTFWLQNVSDVVVHANMATIYGEDPAGTTALGHTVYINGSTNCTINNLVVDGASPGKDCLYLGVAGTPNNRITIKGGKYLNAKRNGISVVGAYNTLIESVEAAYATGGPGAGIDVEANAYGHVSNTVIRRCYTHHNQGSGIINSFGVGTVIEDCVSESNGAYGYGFSSGGGAVFTEGVYRPNVDVVAVTGFDEEAGVLRVAAQPPIGSSLIVASRGGGVKPIELTSTYYIVSKHVGTDGIKIGTSVNWNEVAQLTGWQGSLTNDPSTSELYILSFVDGQSDRCVLRNSTAKGNLSHGLVVSGAGNFLAERCEFISNGGYSEVWVGYARNVAITNCFITGPGVGITASTGGGELYLHRNQIHKTVGSGMYVSDWTNCEISNNRVYDCGSGGWGSHAGIEMFACLRPRVLDNVVTQESANTSTVFGIMADYRVVYGQFVGNDMTGAGNSTATALFVSSPTNLLRDNIDRYGNVLA